MGIEFKRRLKEINGRDAVVAYETLELGATLAPAASGPTAMADAQGISSYTARRKTKVDGITMQLSAALAASSGNVQVRARKNTVAASSSGVVNPGNAFGDVMFTSENLDELILDPGDTLVVDYTKGATESVRTMTTRVNLRLFE